MNNGPSAPGFVAPPIVIPEWPAATWTEEARSAVREVARLVAAHPPIELQDGFKTDARISTAVHKAAQLGVHDAFALASDLAAKRKTKALKDAGLL